MRCRVCGEELRAEVAITEPGWIIFHECITRGATEKEVIEEFERRSNAPAEVIVEENKKEEMKPCPFCGGEGEVYQGRYLHENWAQCKKCHTQLGGTFTSPFNAIKAWNTRAWA